MKVSDIYYHPQFRKSFLRLPKDIQSKAKEKVKIFKENPFYPSLKTHKLHGKLKEQWSFLVKGQYRILFIFDNSDVTFLDIGPHDIYK
ncbi:MAG: type II toxin-antitoxin system mRNA interferase toxin, RelE/StbE family [Candidatus Nealsonbacteria bacterium CG_4_10_14_3_um_filter_36_16]|uniref:Type II toxin-antitoxin system mRNA interferase toxin, RelE/StbE family n=1 Tax=Candidatus Nealsonbacteria bacterium CG_4_10_14_3_um_filter_36_16 TaxID=1974685 RepID=A0A2M7MEX0_9BACT|nr:MAG: type II toxin-antitoxin system mRNA interferase toxin, RelE/StbE family [Candidatus Nealsonbacteria bacterium CG_4_10_14_3_um_filter_36_16]